MGNLKLSNNEIAETLGRTEKDVAQKAKELNLRNRGWTKDQDNFLISVYNNLEYSMEEISEAIGKSESSIRQRARILGIKSNRKIKPFEKEGHKICANCKECLPFDGFVKNSTKPNGIGSYCIACDKLLKKHRNEKAKLRKKEENSNRTKLTEKQCSCCGIVKPIDEFYKSGAMCKICRNNRNKEIRFNKLVERGYTSG